MSEKYQREHVELLLEKLYLKVRLEEANQRLSELIRVVQSVATEQLPDRLLQEVCGAARHMVGAAASAIVLLPPHQREHRCFTSGFGDRPGCPERLETLVLKLLVHMPAPVRAARFASSEALVEDDLDLADGQNRALMLAAIWSANELYGLLLLAGAVNHDEFTGEDESIVLTLCSQLAVAYENILRYEELKSRAEALEREVSSSPSSQPRKRGKAPDWDWPRPTGSSSKAAGTSGWIANRDRARRSGYTFRAWTRPRGWRGRGLQPRRLRPAAKPCCWSKTRPACAPSCANS